MKKLCNAQWLTSTPDVRCLLEPGHQIAPIPRYEHVGKFNGGTISWRSAQDLENLPGRLTEEDVIERVEKKR